MIATSTDGEAEHTDIQLTLRLADAERLRVVLPWLVHALADRPAQPRHTERRRKARAALEDLLSTLSSELDKGESALSA